MAALSKAAILEKLKDMPEWSFSGNAINRKFTLKSFVSAIAFVNKIAEVAEQANHHPDVTINYNLVGISLSTHSESGVTDRDFRLAQAIETLYSQA